jgi:hypothetical protein
MRRTLFSVSSLAVLLFLSRAAPGQAHFLRGDSNHDGKIDISDGISTLGFLFLGSKTPPCMDGADINDSGVVDIGDAIFTFNYLFQGGANPGAPFPVFEGDPTTDGIGCIVTAENPIIDVSGQITDDTTWTNLHVYRVVGVVTVEPPATLTIQAGTTVFGSSTSNPLGVLVVQKGAKIVAVGTENTPVVFTSEKPVGSRHKQDWGGLILTGKADMNIAGKKGEVEGLQGVEYGPAEEAPNDHDSSGQLSYVRIEFGGFALSPNNEVNGLGMFCVGDGTILDHIQSKYVADDAFEWFGGSANFKYGIDIGCTDDMYDTSFGYRGKAQFLVGLQNGDDVETGGNGLEMDDSEAPLGTFTDRPLTRQTFSNVTLCGPGTPATPSAPGGGVGALVRRGTGAQIFNFIFQGFRGPGINIDNGITTENIDPGDLVYDYCVYYKVGLNNNPGGDGWCQTGETGANEETEANGFKYTSCSFIQTKMTHNRFVTDAPTVSPFELTSPDFRPVSAEAVQSAFDPVTLNAGSDSFFLSAPYAGAIAPGTEPKDDWTHKPWVSYQRN